MLIEERASQRLHFESRRDNTPLSAPRVSTGDWVKVGALGERFWCLVNTVHADGVLTASVANDLVLCPWKAGDEVTFREGNILEVASLSDRGRFVQMVLVSGSRVEAAQRWHHWRQSKGVGVAPRPHTQYIVGDGIILG